MTFRPWMIWAAAVVALAVLLGLQTVRLADERADHADTKADHKEQVALAEKATRKAVEDARTEEQRRTDAVQEIANDTQTKLDTALADNADARAAGERLRKRIAELAAASSRKAAGDTQAASPGATTVTTADLLADVQRRLDEAADGIAGFADKAHGSGLACQRAYEALTPSGNNLAR